MSKQTAATDRIMPCLLDRLTDERPQDQAESREYRVMSLQRYRKAVLRDIESLLNSNNHPPGDELYDFEEAAKSVINYGIRNLCGITISELDIDEIESIMKESLLHFEPRILPDSLSLRIVTADVAHEKRALSIEVEGRLWAQPVPDHLLIRTEVDMETGHCSVKD